MSKTNSGVILRLSRRESDCGRTYFNFKCLFCLGFQSAFGQFPGFVMYTKMPLSLTFSVKKTRSWLVSVFCEFSVIFRFGIEEMVAF